MTDFDIQHTGIGWPTVGDASFTLSHGISPSVATLTVAQGATANARLGDLVMLANGRPIVTMRDCAVTGVVAADARTFTVRILDRRHRWKNGGGVINGHWNRRTPKGKLIQESYRTPRQLAKLLLEALGEANADVSGVPDDLPREAAPEAIWDHARPAEALGRLVDALGCRVVLGTDNRVRVCRLGVGGQIPTALVMEGESDTLENTDAPESLLFIAGKTRWQGYLRLQAVGVDLDDSVKPIDELTYKPKRGWGVLDVNHVGNAVTYGRDAEERERARRLAQTTVYRWYRVLGHEQQSGPLQVPGYSGRIVGAWQYLPLPSLPLFASGDDDDAVELRPFVVGQFVNREIANDDNTPPGTVMSGEPNIDHEAGIVKFPEPVYRLTQDKTAYAPAALRLFTTYHLHDAQTRIAERWMHRQQLNPGNRSGSLPVPADDVERRVTLEWDYDRQRGHVFRRWTDNRQELEDAARYYLAAKRAELQPAAGRIVPLRGWHDISPDGAIQQVTWQLAGGVATTTASRNTEHSLYVPPYAMRRRSEKTDAATRSATAGKAET